MMHTASFKQLALVALMLLAAVSMTDAKKNKKASTTKTKSGEACTAGLLAVSICTICRPALSPACIYESPRAAAF